MLEVAKLNAEQLEIDHRVELIHGTIADVPVESTFEGGTCILVFHFITDVNKKLALLKKMGSYLKIGSPFVLVSKLRDTKGPEFEELVHLGKTIG